MLLLLLVSNIYILSVPLNDRHAYTKREILLVHVETSASRDICKVKVIFNKTIDR